MTQLQQYIARFSHVVAQQVTFTNSISTTGGFAYNQFAGGLIICNNLSPLTLTFFTRSSDTATPLQIKDAAGNGVSVTLSNGAVPIPDECFAAAFLMVVSSGASATCTILLKG